LVILNLPTLYFVIGGLLGLLGAAVLGTKAQSMIAAEARAAG
jgi:hypothetical protein